MLYCAQPSHPRADETNARVIAFISTTLDSTPLHSIPMQMGDLNAHFTPGLDDATVGMCVVALADDELAGQLYNLAAFHRMTMVSTGWWHGPTFYHPAGAYSSVVNYIWVPEAMVGDVLEVWFEVVRGDHFKFARPEYRVGHQPLAMSMRVGVAVEHGRRAERLVPALAGPPVCEDAVALCASHGERRGEFLSALEEWAASQEDEVWVSALRATPDALYEKVLGGLNGCVRAIFPASRRLIAVNGLCEWQRSWDNCGRRA